MNSDPRRIEAAGGVVWRAGDGGVEVLTVHRPKYDDWSLPKGKLERGETAKQAARREVEEESGYACDLGAELPTVLYDDNKGRPKRVRYWAMHVTGGKFRVNSEVDEIRWVLAVRAGRHLSYDRDVSVVAALGDVLAAWH